MTGGKKYRILTFLTVAVLGLALFFGANAFLYYTGVLSAGTGFGGGLGSALAVVFYLVFGVIAALIGGLLLLILLVLRKKSAKAAQNAVEDFAFSSLNQTYMD